MRPIVWGFILMVVGAILWIMFSIVYGIIGGFSGRVPPEGWALVYLFGSLFLFSLPVAVFIEIVNWVRGKTKKQATVGVEPALASPSPTTQQVYYCTRWSRPLRYSSPLHRWYCESCGVHAPTKEELLQSAMRALDLGDTKLAKKFLEQAQKMSELA